MNTSTRELLFLVFLVVLVATLGSRLLAPPEVAQANIWNNLWRNLTAPFRETPTPPLLPSQPAAPVPLYKPALDYERAVIEAVKRASPAVVSLTISKNVPIIERCPVSPLPDLPPEFREFFELPEVFRPCPKGTELREVGGGSGFVISEDGLVLTNKHVVRDPDASYTVFTNDGRKYEAKVLARDPAQDLAVLKVEVSGLPTVTLGDSDALELGQTVIAIGNALGEFRNTVSVGVISGLSRTVTASGGDSFKETIHDVIQTDAAINPGNSGGPLLNLRGEVIGISTAIAVSAENIGFAIPINQAKRDIRSVKEFGEIQAAFLGVRYVSITPAQAKREKLPVEYGALVRGTADGPAIFPGSPAERAGLKAEDIILEVQGTKIDEEHPLGSLINRLNVGDAVRLKVRRGSEVLTLQATLVKRAE